MVVPTMRVQFFISLLLFLPNLVESQTIGQPPTTETELEPKESEPPFLNLSTLSNKTYIFSNHFWWESPDHQITTIVTLLALAQNLSAIPILPTTPKPNTEPPSSKSLLGDYFSKIAVQQVQPVLTLPQFLNSSDYRTLRAVETGAIPFPKDSQEEYESKLKIFGRIEHTRIRLNLPHVDPEHTNQFCDRFPATAYVVQNTRYIFLDRIHFLHFCAEKYLPWWYDIRHRISPRKEYYDFATEKLRDMKKPVAVVHINDVLESEKVRENEEIERYAREIVDALRKSDALGGSLYFIYHSEGRNVRRVVALLKEEFDNVESCDNMYDCMGRVPRMATNSQLNDEEFKDLFRPDVALRMVEWALGTSSDLFVGNIHSPYSRNICLHRKAHGKPYSILSGFAELKKIWKWNL